MIQSVRGVMTGEARTLIGGDILISTEPRRGRRVGSRRASIARLAGEPVAPARTRCRRDADDGAAGGRAEGRRADGGAARRRAGFPLYGEREAADGQRYSHALLEQHGVLVRPELLRSSTSRSATRSSIGRTTFVIRGVHRQRAGPPQRRVQPRAARARSTAHDLLVDAGLLGFGSRATYQLHAPGRRSAASSRAGTSAARDFKDRFVNVRSFRSTEDDIGEDLARAENYLSLVGLVIVILGGIGVSSVTRVFVQQKLKSIAILKCVGARTRAGARHLPAAGRSRSAWPAACSAWRWPPASSRSLPAFVPTTGPTGAPMCTTR